MSSGLIYLLIPVAAIVAIVLGAFIVLTLQKSQPRPEGFPPATAPTGGATPARFEQSSGETREAYVRQHWQRPGVVANGVTLIDLYDRIGELERRLADAERQLEEQRPPS